MVWDTASCIFVGGLAILIGMVFLVPPESLLLTCTVTSGILALVAMIFWAIDVAPPPPW